MASGVDSRTVEATLTINGVFMSKSFATITIGQQAAPGRRLGGLCMVDREVRKEVERRLVAISNLMQRKIDQARAPADWPGQPPSAVEDLAKLEAKLKAMGLGMHVPALQKLAKGDPEPR